jgi:hypothetical protein
VYSSASPVIIVVVVVLHLYRQFACIGSTSKIVDLLMQISTLPIQQ